MLLAAAGRRTTPITTVVAIRADFYGHCAAFPELAALLDAGSTLLCPMAPDEIRAAIEGPAELAGLHVEPGLTELILRDVGDEPGALPLLSHALLETWRRRTRRTLTVAGYRAAGGVQGAIAQTAESVYRGLDADDQVRARRIFLRLTELGDGTEDTSRRVERQELADAVDGADTEVVLDRLAQARLVTVDGETVQVAHEALIREWPRLRAWLDDDRDGRRLHRHLTHAARDWAALGHEPTELYRGPRLAGAREWLARDDHREELNALELAFVDASIAREDAELSAQEEQVRTASDPIVACAGCRSRWPSCSSSPRRGHARPGPAESGRPRGRRRPRDVADRRHLAAGGAVERAAEREPVRRRAARGRGEPAAGRRADQGALLSAVVAEPRRLLTLPTGPTGGLWMLPGATRVLVLSGDRLGVWDVRTGRRSVDSRSPTCESAAVRADGLIAAARTDGTVVFLTTTGRRSGPVLRTGLHGPQAGAVFSPDGHLLAVGYSNWADPRPVAASTRLRLFDVDRRVPRPPLPGTSASVTAAAFSPDGRRLAIGTADDRVILRDTSSGAVVGSPITTVSPPLGLAFDPTRDRLAIGTIGPGVDVVVPETGAVVGQLVDAPPVDAPAYDPAGTTLAVAGDGPVRLYDADSLLPVPNRSAPGFAPAVPTGTPLDAQTAQAHVVFAAGGRVVVAGTTGPTTVWDPQGTSALDRPLDPPLPGPPSYVFPMPGGRFVAAPDNADSVTLYDRRTLRPLGAPLTPGARRRRRRPRAAAAHDLRRELLRRQPHRRGEPLGGAPALRHGDPSPDRTAGRHRDRVGLRRVLPRHAHDRGRRHPGGGAARGRPDPRGAGAAESDDELRVRARVRSPRPAGRVRRRPRRALLAPRVGPPPDARRQPRHARHRVRDGPLTRRSRARRRDDGQQHRVLRRADPAAHGTGRTDERQHHQLGRVRPHRDEGW